jgi:hypothetical protein
MDNEGWAQWWESRGKAHMELLLWALWDPIGGVPLDEYSDYCDHVVQVLREASEADAPLAERATTSAQLERNALWVSSVERLARRLADLRGTQMGLPLDAETERHHRETERHAAEKLLEWFEWEMGGGIPAYLIPLDQRPSAKPAWVGRRRGPVPPPNGNE